MTSDSTIHGRTFDAGGVPVGSDLDLVEDNENKQFLGSVAADAEGRFLLAWFEYRGTSRGIFGQAFEPDGTAVSSAFPIAKRTNPPEQRPDIHGVASGKKDGHIVAEGTPEGVARAEGGFAGRSLGEVP